MKSTPKSVRRQRGFTLVEMSVTMAAAGLLFAAVTTGQELVDQAKATKLLNDVKTVEMQIQQYAQLKGRLPGDCDADGVIDYKADANASSQSLRSDTGNTARADEYSYSVLMPTIPADGAVASAQTDGCSLNGTTGSAGPATVTVSTSNANVWLNDLKVAGVVSNSAPNRRLAKMVNEDFLFVGKLQDNGGSSAAGADYNAIVIHNVPQWMARRVAVAINGQDARADRSRVRLLNRTGTAGDYSQLWQTKQGAEGTVGTSDGMVSVVYFFDRVPESQQQ
jgi:hypothetical protein